MKIPFFLRYDFFHKAKWIRAGVCTTNFKNQLGLLHINKEQFIPIEADQIIPQLNSQDYLVTLNEKKGLYDKNGREILACQYENINTQVDIYLLKESGAYFLKLRHEKAIPIRADYAYLTKIKDQVYINAKRGGIFGLLNLKNEEVLSFDHQSISFDKKGYVFAQKNVEQDDQLQL